MLSYRQIVEHAERQERKARRERKLPVYLGGLGDDALRRRKIPFLGHYVPRGFKRVNVGETFGDRYGWGTRGHEFLLVDIFGEGAESELALTHAAFFRFVQENPGYHYAIIEAGQFQVVIGVFKRVEGRRTKGEPRDATLEAAAPAVVGVTASLLGD